MPEPPKRGSIQAVVIDDQRGDSLSLVIDRPLREAKELHVVVLKPFYIALVETPPVDTEVSLLPGAVRPHVSSQQIADPCPFVRFVA